MFTIYSRGGKARTHWPVINGQPHDPIPDLAGAFLFRVVNVIGESFRNERGRWALWAPVFLGFGIGIYFSLPDEPWPWLGLIGVGVMGVLLYLLRPKPAMQLMLIPILLIAVGFSAVQLRSLTRHAPVIAERLGPVNVTGQLIAIERQEGGVRYLIAPTNIQRLAPAQTPARIRLRLSGKSRADPSLAAGDWVWLRAVLLPPPGPVTPGGFDYGRMLWFDRIGAVGFILSPPRRTGALSPEDVWSESSLRLTGLRDRLTARVIAAIPGDSGVVAAALMTGDRAAISKPVNGAMKNSGLAHLLSISGLHMGMVAGILFFSLRAFLAVIEPVALRYPIKKWSAGFALAGLLLYLLISGASIPAQRSFLMTGLVLAAVMLDRIAISMRSVMLAAGAILLIAPESLHGASFQMSFAAVIALVALYERFGAQLSYRAGEDGWFLRGLKYSAATLSTSLVAGLATAPFAAFHFNRYTVYGLLSNMLAVPLTGVVIMPCAIIAFMLMPFGLERWALWPMGIGVQWVLEIAYWVAGLPGAVMAVGQAPDAALLLIVGGGLWLCLWEGGWRGAGFAPMLIGLCIWALSAAFRPDILVEGQGRVIAVRNADGDLLVNSRRMARHANKEWALQEGLMQGLAPAREDSAAACDASFCMFAARSGDKVALVRDAARLQEGCAQASIVIAGVLAEPCQGPRLVLDTRDLSRGGAHTLWLTSDGVTLETVAGQRGSRPWVPEVE